MDEGVKQAVQEAIIKIIKDTQYLRQKVKAVTDGFLTRNPPSIAQK